MNNSVSDRSFYIESEEEDDEEKEFNKSIEDGGESDSSAESCTENRQPNNPSSHNNQWPQSYRQSIDLYGSVPSPSIGFLGTPSLSRLGSSFLSSSLTRRHTPETLPFLSKPLPTVADEQQHQQQRRSSHSLLPPLPRRYSVRKDEKASRVTHDHHPMPRHSSFAQAVINGINVLCGVGILSTPFAVKEGGWLGLFVLLIFAVLSFYTGLLLRYCLDSQPGLETYPDIGQAAFGTGGRIAISIILYVELYACCIEYIILESDNLSSLFPNAQLSLGGFVLDAHLLFAIVTTLAVLPTVWLRDLSVLSYISAGGVIASILVVLCLFWVGLVDGVGFESKGTPLNLATLPVAMGLYGYCYSGHAVFPNIYTSLENRSQYPAILLTCFCICTLMYGGVAVMGYTMFGELTQSQFTLNMPHDLVATKIALWTTVVNPFTKYPLLQIMQIMNVILCTNTNIYHTSAHNACSLEFYFVFGKTSERTVTRTTYAYIFAFVAQHLHTYTHTHIHTQNKIINDEKKLTCLSLIRPTYALTISPVAMSLEELVPSNKSHVYAILIRTALVVSTLVVGLCIPFFGLVMSLIGSLFTMLVTLILPCACYLSILRGRITRFQGTLCIIIIMVGVVSSAFGTFSAISKIVESLRSPT